ncbi:hypothetical protein CKM354_000311900 [Cercospora kikuchii]|uniref:Glutathione S-transferase n=1 Tax=Cercospora kikuchii TaxID=84275 RepID=A0A9P3CAL4_9PEZI|nr:uncharacterized protein CKM354_000311900 [Cercospora kikuchii]GIZ39747.1 hypothetical protein CKM354_000311900 [Cercospora kikuchii]
MATQQEPASKKQRTQPTYELLYHPQIPGRGEFIRLAFEAKGVSYTDIANEDSKNGYSKVQDICIGDNLGKEGNPPVFSPPALRISGAGPDGNALIISQTPNCLIYLGDKLGLVGSGGEQEKFWVQQLALTALDLNNEVHDTHHPVGVSLYYEDQKEESLRKAKDVRENRLPKFFSYFTRTLKWNAEKAKHRYLVGESLTYADTTVWQVLDGLYFAFPKEMQARQKEFPELLDTFYNSVKEELKAYLESNRRLAYSQGVFRYYPELDRQS